MKDWDALNAYVDGELDAAQAAAVEARLAERPDLKRDLDRIGALKRQLAALRPAEAKPGAVATFRRVQPRRAAAIAAGLVAAVGLAAGWYALRANDAGWVAEVEEIHGQLSQRAYVVEERHTVQLVSSGQALEFRAPDLTASHLFLVDVATDRGSDQETIAMHYRGLRGCRLTVVAVAAPADWADGGRATTSNGLLQTWAYGGFAFAVVANGMDPQRFRSVAEYVKAAITESAVEKAPLRFAMAEDYRRAVPCA